MNQNQMQKGAMVRNYFKLGLYIMTFMTGVMGYMYVWKPYSQEKNMARLEAEAKAIYERRMQKQNSES